MRNDPSLTGRRRSIERHVPNGSTFSRDVSFAELGMHQCDGCQPSLACGLCCRSGGLLGVQRVEHSVFDARIGQQARCAHKVIDSLRAKGFC